MALLKNRTEVVDAFIRVPDEGEIPIDGDVLLSVSQLAGFLAAGHVPTARRGAVGLHAPGDVDPEKLRPYLSSVAVIALEIPRYTDGRAYSTARLLRDRYGYEGELRAIGHVLRDQLLYLERCGFDAFSLAPGQSVAGALEAFNEFSVFYQPATKNAHRAREHARQGDGNGDAAS